ncbi:hypothetical protein FRB93_013784 [Tulasnella sp. JGI-2019a]|nr:hypothetical protein FRB93_013784 [Tulasnella sp. JGI-2019a]
MAINEGSKDATSYDQPHLIMTYTAIISLCILQDGFSRLDRPGIGKLLRSTQLADGSFTPSPKWGESDVRLVYCAFILSSLLDDWSHIDVGKAVEFIKQCRTYEGGYGQTPGQEAQGGTTYCSVAALSLAKVDLTPNEREETVRWLMQRQTGGFQGRTEKTQDACYSFWCGAALQILGAKDFVNADANTEFISRCQFKFGGIAKVPDERPDPFHTYMSLASLSLYPLSKDAAAEDAASWSITALDPVVNAQEKTAQWARDTVSKK